MFCVAHAVKTNGATFIKRNPVRNDKAILPGLTMRLSDAGLRRHPTKLIYPNHRLPPWFIEDAAPRSLELLLGSVSVP
jgi:hypothetical protein